MTVQRNPLKERETQRGRPFSFPPLSLSLSSGSRFDKKLIRDPDGTPISWPMWQPFINDAVPPTKITEANMLSKYCTYIFNTLLYKWLNYSGF